MQASRISEKWFISQNDGEIECFKVSVHAFSEPEKKPQF
jgi:hypothetical protein